MDLDDKINEDTDAWEYEYHKTERERVRLKDARRQAIWKFVRLGIVSVAGIAAIGGGAFGITIGVKACNVRQDANDAQDEAVERFYDEQRIACINKHGREQCEIWFEIGLAYCKNSNQKTYSRIVDHIDARAKKLGTSPGT